LVFAPARRHFGGPNSGLMVGQAHVFGPKLRRDRYQQTGVQRDLNHLLIHALGVHIELDTPSALGEPLENRFPERVASLGDSALAVDAEGHTSDRRTGGQERAQGIPAVRSVFVGRESFNRMICVRAVSPLVSMGPEAELKMQAASRSFVA